MQNFKENKIIIRLVAIVFFIAFLIGVFFIRYYWQIFSRLNTVNRQQIEASITHFEKNLIKEVYQKIENRVNK